MKLPLPLTFFEKAKSAILGIIPDFFKREFNAQQSSSEFSHILKPEGLLKNRVPEKREDRQKSITALKFMCTLYDSEHGQLKKSIDLLNGIKEQGMPSVMEHVLNDEEYIIASRVAHERDSSDYVNTLVMNIMEMVYRIELHGKKIFRVEEGLFNELSITDCDKIDSAFLRLPFETICFHIPSNRHLQIRGNVLEWIHISEYQESDSRKFKILCTARNNVCYNNIFIVKEGYVLPQIKSQVSERFKGSKLAIEETNKLFSLILSILLYLNSSEVDSQEIRPYIATKTNSRLPVCSLGRTIKINDRIRKLCSGESETEQTIHILKWTVRGHFRNQACGEGMKDRKIIWIRPYIKGSERGNTELKAKPSIYQLK